MKTLASYTFFKLFLLAVISLPASAADTEKAYELMYDEQEAGTEIYRSRYLVTDNYLRIDEPDEESGYILFDNSTKTIYSVSHGDKSILVIKNEAYEQPDMSARVSIEYKQLADAPTIAGKPVYNYRVAATENNDTCMDIHLAEGLLPEVTSVLRAYQKVVASQQVKILTTTPEEYQTTCMLADQVYNEGLYYSKGLPIQEWHSNGRKKQLSDYKVADVEASLFVVPEGYRQYSLE